MNVKMHSEFLCSLLAVAALMDSLLMLGVNLICASSSTPETEFLFFFFIFRKFSFSMLKVL